DPTLRRVRGGTLPGLRVQGRGVAGSSGGTAAGASGRVVPGRPGDRGRSSRTAHRTLPGTEHHPWCRVRFRDGNGAGHRGDHRRVLEPTTPLGRQGTRRVASDRDLHVHTPRCPGPRGVRTYGDADPTR